MKNLVTIQGIKHYSVYYEARDQAHNEAIIWFYGHLKPAVETGSK